MQTNFFEGAIVRLKHPENYPSSPAINQGGLTRIVEINDKSERVRVEGIDAMLSKEEIMGVSIMADNDLQHIELDFAIKHPFSTNGCGAIKCEDKPFVLKMRSCFKDDLQDYFDEYNKSLCTLINVSSMKFD